MTEANEKRIVKALEDLCKLKQQDVEHLKAIRLHLKGIEEQLKFIDNPALQSRQMRPR